MHNLPSNPKPLLLITALLRSLGHELRTPLSVISNELYNLSFQVPKSEISLAQTRCLEIGDRLKQICDVSLEQLKVEQLDIGSFLPKLLARYFGLTNLELDLSLKVRLSLLEFSQALECLASLLNLRSATFACTYMVQQQEDHIYIQGKKSEFTKYAIANKCFDSLTAYSLEFCSQHTQEAVIADAVFLWHGIAISIAIVGRALNFEMQLPLILGSSQ